MPTLLERIRGIRQEHAEAYHQDLAGERAELLQIAIRDFLDTQADDDAENLMRVMEFLELSDEDYKKTVEGIGKVCSAVAAKEFHDEQTEDIKARSAEAQRQMYVAKAQSDRWQKRLRELQATVSRGSGIADRLREATSEFPSIFDDEGNPTPELRPLIANEKQAKREAAKRDEEDADQRMLEWIDVRLRSAGLNQNTSNK